MINHDYMMVRYKMLATPVTDHMDYDQLVSSMGYKTALTASVGDYQGSYYYLLECEGLYGYLVFGYGSCSGCDALQGCEGDEEQIRELRDSMAREIDWRTPEGMLAYFTEKDFKAEWYSYHEEELAKFIKDATLILEAAGA